MKYVVFDIEVANDPNQVGWDNLAALGVSWAVFYVSWWDRYIHSQERSLQDMASLMAEADLLVSWNGHKFDLPLLLATLDRLQLPYPQQLLDTQHCDLLLSIQRITGQMISLGEAATYTLAYTKTGKGDMAPSLAQAGCWDVLASYCENDVRLTRRLYEFSRDHGYLLCEEGRIPIQVLGGVAASSPVAEPATEKQMAFIHRLRCERGEQGPLPPDLSKGQARKEIDRLTRMERGQRQR